MITNQYTPDIVPAPGETLLETIEAVGMTQAELAERTGRPRKTINEIIQGKAAITPETALQLEKVLGVPASFWLNYERAYRENLAREEDKQRLTQHLDWLKGFPISAMMKLGWIRQSKDKLDQLRSLLGFFALAAPEQWEVVWQKPDVAYRTSATFRNDPKAVSIWLRQGEIEGQKIVTRSFSEVMFKEALGQIRSLTVEPPEVFEPQVERVCADAGVAFVLVPELPGTKACGATRWLTPTKALMQLSLRYRSDDHLWFTFFHEAGHILLHGKKDVFVEGDGTDDVQEREANEFAANLLIPKAEYRRFIATADYRSKEAIRRFAQEIGIAPGIIVGRLQKEGLVPYKNCNELKRRFEWKVR